MTVKEVQTALEHTYTLLLRKLRFPGLPVNVTILHSSEDSHYPEEQ